MLSQRRPWRWIFSKVPCKKSRLDASATAALAKWHLRPDPRSDVIARQPEYRAHVSDGAGQPPGRFKVTTDSNHKFEVYLNLAARMKLRGINQLWVADITYIRLKAEFVYLAVILDGFSRKVVGWALDRTLAIRLTIGALEQAIESRQPEPGLVHHSDRGLQYASEEYIKVLENNGVIPSMSRPANPYDNASCESFMKTLKREEIYANKYDDLENLRANIEEFIEQYYNRQRLHSALGYRSPEEFE